MNAKQATQNCPYCKIELDTVFKRKKKCPQCDKFIFVRNGQLMTEDEANIEDWLIGLAQFGITKKDFDSNRQALSKQFA